MTILQDGGLGAHWVQQEASIGNNSTRGLASAGAHRHGFEGGCIVVRSSPCRQTLLHITRRSSLGR